MRTIAEAGEALRKGKTTSIELVQNCLARVRQLQPVLNAFVTVVEAQAITQAAERDRELAAGQDRGPLHGIPFALKDVFETKGIRTTCGSLLFAGHIPERDCAVAERLSQAGAVLIGKTGMHELAYGITSTNPHFGAVRNPWDPSRVPGGSSGGSGAAVSAGMCWMAMGSDTGGSIRIPAAFCGVVGLKPTFGRVSRHGVLPLDFTLDHMGPLTRSVRDAGLVLDAIAGPDPRDHTCSKTPVEPYADWPGEVRDYRIGIPEQFFFEGIHPAIDAATRGLAAKAEAAGARLIPVTLPDMDRLNAVGRVILLAEAAATLEPDWSRRAEIGDDVLALLDQGRCLAATEYLQAQRLRRWFQLEFDRIWSTVDCLLTPTTPNLAPRIGETTVNLAGQSVDARLASTRHVRGVNVLGLPALALPAGLAEGLPVSVQLIGKAFSERTLLNIGGGLERLLGTLPDPPLMV